jgi:hypothetical protein
MKKLMLFAGLLCLHLSLLAGSISKPGITNMAPINASDRAKAHFSANYSGARDAEWYSLPDRNMYCIFHQGTAVNRVFYDSRGYWQYTLLGYPASGLDKNVKELVTDFFNGYRILYVNEIRSYKDAPVYIINIENEDQTKLIRVTGDEIEQEQSFKKS